MRKMISILIVGGLSVLLAGCGSADKNPTEGNTASDNVQTQTPAADNEIQEDTQTAAPSADSQQGNDGGKNDTANDTINDTAQGKGDAKTQNDVKKETSSVQGGSSKKGTQLISKDKAKQIAIKDAGVSDKDVSQLSVHLETDDGVRQYEVEFHAGKHEYDYEIDARTGAIRSKDVDD